MPFAFGTLQGSTFQRVPGPPSASFRPFSGAAGTTEARALPHFFSRLVIVIRATPVARTMGLGVALHQQSVHLDILSRFACSGPSEYALVAARRTLVLRLVIFTSVAPDLITAALGIEMLRVSHEINIYYSPLIGLPPTPAVNNSLPSPLRKCSCTCGSYFMYSGKRSMYSLNVEFIELRFTTESCSPYLAQR